MADALRTVGRDELVCEVGRGGMAAVYMARQVDLDRNVALKELAAFHAGDASFAERFLRESRLAGSLNHPNIVTVHEYIVHESTPYIVMEYLERGSLRPHVGSLGLAQIFGVLEGILSGLAHAAASNIVHRDLKPENLMLTGDGRIKIADFGIAKAVDEVALGAFHTQTGTTVGTPAYMAPEQAMATNISPRTDLYSVGIMAYELVAGRVPFPGSESPMAVLLHHLNDPVPPLNAFNSEVEPELVAWIDRLLVKDPDHRTESALAAWDELEEVAIKTLGPRWRREARLIQRAPQERTPAPLTPAPFEGTSAAETPDAVTPAPESAPSGESDFVSFQLGAGASPVSEPGVQALTPAPTPPPVSAPTPPPVSAPTP